MKQLLKKIICMDVRIALVALIGLSNITVGYTPQYIDKVVSYHLAMYGTTEEEKITEAVLQNNPNKEKKLVQTTLSARQLHELAFKAAPIEPLKEADVIDDQTVSKLEFVRGEDQTNENAPYLAGIIAQDVATRGGFKQIFSMLCQPAEKVAAIKHRQGAIKAFAEDDQLLSFVQKKLTKKTKEAEASVLRFFHTEDPFNETIINELYFGKSLEHLNTSPTAMELNAWRKNLTNYLWITGPVSIPFFLFQAKAFFIHFYYKVKGIFEISEEAEDRAFARCEADDESDDTENKKNKYDIGDIDTDTMLEECRLRIEKLSPSLPTSNANKLKAMLTEVDNIREQVRLETEVDKITISEDLKLPKDYLAAPNEITKMARGARSAVNRLGIVNISRQTALNAARRIRNAAKQHGVDLGNSSSKRLKLYQGVVNQLVRHVLDEAPNSSIFSKMKQGVREYLNFPYTVIDTVQTLTTGSNPVSKLKALALGSLFLVCTVAPISNAYSQAKLQQSIHLYLQKSLIGVATYLDTARTLYKELSKHDSFASHCPSLSDLEVLVSRSNDYSSEFNQLVNLLDNETFRGDASFFSRSGRVLAAYKLISKCKDELARIMNAVGQVDAYAAVASLVSKNSTSVTPYCFVQFIATDKPYLKATDFWNPFVSQDTAVPNNLEFGGPDLPGGIILTGPNTGGKSTTIKALVINGVLAQAFGIAAAREMVMTPFKKIASYLNITDNTAGGISLFKAEVLRARHLIRQLDALRPEQFMLVIMDEIFSGTNPDDAVATAKAFIEDLSRPNCMYVNATHFKQLTALEAQKLCMNYRMGVILNANGKVVRYTYLLEKGISQVSSALQVAQEAGAIRTR